MALHIIMICAVIIWGGVKRQKRIGDRMYELEKKSKGQ